MQRTAKYVLLLVCILILGSFKLENDSSKRLRHFNLKNGIAIHGYDPVSYFTKQKPEEGKTSIYAYADGIKYLFSNQENKALFIKNYRSYEPQYGGWCAYAMGNSGEKVDIDPSTFKIIDKKLYLFYNAYFNNTLKTWNKDQTNLKAKADKNWEKIYK